MDDRKQPSLFGNDKESINQYEAKARAKEGIQIAESKANHDAPTWSQAALLLLKQFIRMKNGKPFFCIEYSNFCLAHGLVKPKDGRAFGGIMRRAAKKKLIEKAGTDNNGSVTGHNNLATVWIEKGRKPNNRNSFSYIEDDIKRLKTILKQAEEKDGQRLSNMINSWIESLSKRLPQK